jgi:hypothetical protein
MLSIPLITIKIWWSITDKVCDDVPLLFIVDVTAGVVWDVDDGIGISGAIVVSVDVAK